MKGKYDSYHLIKAYSENENKYVILLALYVVKKSGNVLLFDTRKGEYYGKKEIKVLGKIIKNVSFLK